MLLDDCTFRRLHAARDFLALSAGQPRSLQEAASIAGMSQFHFIRQFAALFGSTPRQFQIQLRIDRAKRLLASREMSVTEVCLEVGCTSLGSFSARFTQLVGETPTSYRARDHSAMASVPGCVAKDLTRPSRNGEAQAAPVP